MNREERRNHKHHWTTKPSMPHLGTFCMHCGQRRRTCSCRCGCHEPAVMGRPPFLCKPCWQETDASLEGAHGPGAPRPVNATVGDVAGPEGGYMSNGRCICGHLFPEHKETIPGEFLCMTCFADPENYDGCKQFRLDANAI